MAVGIVTGSTIFQIKSKDLSEKAVFKEACDVMGSWGEDINKLVIFKTLNRYDFQKIGGAFVVNKGIKKDEYEVHEYSNGY